MKLMRPIPILPNGEAWLSSIKNSKKTTKIGLVGKYVQLHDAYLSVAEALRHAGYSLNSKIEIKWIDSETLTEEKCDKKLSGLDGIIIPGGFGNRGIEGMILAAHFARTKHLPYLGICLGMQIAVMKNLHGMQQESRMLIPENSTSFVKTK